MVHEASHVHRDFRGSLVTQLDEVRAFSRELSYIHGRRPDLAERARTWAMVKSRYPELMER
ncbi:MAG: hypothetical protein IT384_24840 [Deltaproteobacteria bacterium]|nr:hypothetical protein [Deltaproteobacteria bacterium]